MRPPTTMQGFREAGLGRHQARLVQEVLAHPVPVRLLLAGPAGLGKSFAAVQVARELARVEPACRILVIGPGSLAPSLEIRLARVLDGVTVRLVNRAVFRELQERAPGGRTLWPLSFAAAMGMDTAGQEDVLASLGTVAWDLVILEDVEAWSRSRWTLLRTLLDRDSCYRVLLLSRTAEPPMIDVLPARLQVVRWQEDERSDWEARPEPLPPPAGMGVVPFLRTAGETALLRGVLALAGILSPSDLGRMVQKVLARHAASSPLALERVLRSLRHALGHAAGGIGMAQGLGVPSAPAEGDLEKDQDATVAPVAGPSPWKDDLEALAALEENLDRLEALVEDTKLEALLHHLEGVYEAGRPIGVICALRETAAYLHTVLTDRGMRCWLLTGGHCREEQGATLASFRAEGGVLVVTTVALMGLDLRCVKAFIHYDPPAGSSDRLARLSRSPEATHHLLLDRSEALPVFPGIGTAYLA
jgi:DNA polymerase III delta prime subunit